MVDFTLCNVIQSRLSAFKTENQQFWSQELPKRIYVTKKQKRGLKLLRRIYICIWEIPSKYTKAKKDLDRECIVNSGILCFFVKHVSEDYKLFCCVIHPLGVLNVSQVVLHTATVDIKLKGCLTVINIPNGLCACETPKLDERTTSTGDLSY